MITANHARRSGRACRRREELFTLLDGFGIHIDAVTEKLQADGVAAFAASFDQLIAALEEARS